MLSKCHSSNGQSSGRVFGWWKYLNDVLMYLSVGIAKMHVVCRWVTLEHRYAISEPRLWIIFQLVPAFVLYLSKQQSD
jgi:hypothetical protein